MKQENDQPHRCSWVSITRCRYPGSFSHSNFGEGPWYCSGHAHCHDPIEGARIVQESEARYPHGAPRVEEIVASARRSYQASIGKPNTVLTIDEARAAFRRIGKPSTDPRAWADRIIERHQAGETLTQISLEMACAVRPQAIREPGSDDA